MIHTTDNSSLIKTGIGSMEAPIGTPDLGSLRIILCRRIWLYVADSGRNYMQQIAFDRYK